MSRTVFCHVLQREADGLDFPPHPGSLGQRIYENISREAWQRWLAHLTVLINDNGLSTADPASMLVIEQHMLGFLFSEGEFGNFPAGYSPPKRKK
jgi:Fe-S cluster biosynthesis and repair protein YggX